jgi:hypothetical protein
MARVQAVRALEAIEGNQIEQAGRIGLPSPGVVIVIENGPGKPDRLIGPRPPVIEVEPGEFRDMSQPCPSVMPE